MGVALEPLTTGTGKIKVLISRRNKSLAVEEVESLVVERIANMKIEDRVQQMITQGVTNLNLDPRILQIAQDEAGKLSSQLTIGINENIGAIAKLNKDFNTLNARIVSVLDLVPTTTAISLRIDLLETRITSLENASTTAATSATSTSSLGEWVSSLSTALTDGITSVLQSLGSSKALAAVLGVFDKLFAREIHTDTLCVGDVCVTQEQFLRMVQASGAASESPAASPMPAVAAALPEDDTASATLETILPEIATSSETILPTASSTPPVSEPTEQTSSAGDNIELPATMSVETDADSADSSQATSSAVSSSSP